MRERFKQAPRPFRQIKPAKPENRKRTLLKRAAIFGALALLLTALNLLKLSAAVSEWFTRNISGGLTGIAARLTAWLSPFSVFECLVIVVVFYGIALLVRWIRYLVKVKRKWYPLVKSLLAAGIAILTVMNVYAACAGFAYQRAPLRLPASETVYWGEQYEAYAQAGQAPVETVADHFYADYVRLSKNLPRDANGNTAVYSLSELSKILRQEFKRAFDGDPYFFPYTPRAKTVVNSWFLSSVDIAGIAFLPTGEANINTMPSEVSLVPIAYTMAHELAHTRGVMRENDANLAAYYVLLTSDDDFLRYAGYWAVFSEMRYAVMLGNNLTETAVTNAFQKYPDPAEALREKNNVALFWENYRGPFALIEDFLSKASAWFNDLYLKMSGVEDGTDSYHNFPSGQTDTGNTDPGTGEVVYAPVYNRIQKLFFALYEEPLKN